MTNAGNPYAIQGAFNDIDVPPKINKQVAIHLISKLTFTS
jgi:hypothetical protein